MNDLFNEFISNITLTPSQQEDALRKYTGVCERMWMSYLKYHNRRLINMTLTQVMVKQPCFKRLKIS